MKSAAEVDLIESFIARWRGVTASELATAQSFVIELCRLIDVPAPHATADQDYMFERPIVFRHGDGASSAGRIDCYRRGAFVLEAKKLRQGGFQGKGFDDALLRARSQAEGYARALPAEEGRPPFLMVVDVGNVIELYAEFTRTGATYIPFPDPRSHRLRLADLRDEAVRTRLRAVWLDPLSLDPTRQSAKVTREIAAHLAEVARSLEASGHAPETVAGFLTRCLFSMFAEDVQLIPKGSFTELLGSFVADAPSSLSRGSNGDEGVDQFVPLIGALWKEMDSGGFSVVLRHTLPRFNGKLFKQPDVLPLTRAQIRLLIEASKADWTQVEPAIFGTLLERALDPLERHALGAHYTPRAYVDRLVQPTVVEPLRGEWANVQAAALLLASEGRHKEAVAEVRAFHHRLCSLRVLDPACGSGNFLYVALEHLKRLEGEVLNQLHDLGEGQALLEAEGLTVDPHQFLGLEINPRAAAIAELVLWIGYLQWHFRTRGSGLPPEPVLKDFRNIENRDAVLAHDGVEFVTDEQGIPVTLWDGRTYRKHPVTGEDVPDETARVPLERYRNPRPAEWPEADVVVGNPPFIGKGNIRAALGDGYVEALRGAWKKVPESADFVMYWWHHAAQLVGQGKLARFGFITTNSLRQTFNRRVVQAALDAGLHLDFAIPDHPWVDSADGAAVRIAMTVAQSGQGEGRLICVDAEGEAEADAVHVTLAMRAGSINADLTVGANVSAAVPLGSNRDISNTGYILGGRGFVLSSGETESMSKDPACRSLIYPLFNGEDIVGDARRASVIDASGYGDLELRAYAPIVWQRLRDRVFPERQTNRDPRVRDRWWLFRRSNDQLRAATKGLSRFIVTPETAKHRIFVFLDGSSRPEHVLIVISVDDAWVLGVLSSRVHVMWALAAGGTLEDRPRYNKSRCFETFPFPAAAPEQQARIGDLAEQIDALRKRVLAEHDDLTLTGLYNVLEKLRAGTALNAKEKGIHDKGLVAVLRSLHDELDAAVLAAYGWSDLGGAGWQEGRHDETLLERLVALNAERAAEEAQGRVRWLRPDFQNPRGAAAPQTEPMRGGETETLFADEAATAAPAARTGAGKTPWPPSLPDQMAALAGALGPVAQTVEELAGRFSGKGKWKARLPELLAALETLGRARRLEDGRWMG
jgi:hypothetical protein